MVLFGHPALRDAFGQQRATSAPVTTGVQITLTVVLMPITTKLTYSVSTAFQTKHFYGLSLSLLVLLLLLHVRWPLRSNCYVEKDIVNIHVLCEYCIPDKTIIWVISFFAGTATTFACAVAFDYAYAKYKYRKVMEKAKKEAEEKAKKEAEAAEHGV